MVNEEQKTGGATEAVEGEDEDDAQGRDEETGAAVGLTVTSSAPPDINMVSFLMEWWIQE